tara:strand:- start:432 stop:1421 length:990 start_codon:yes stop_codon:yes gene_type:complete
VSAQNLNDLYFGTDSTFEVVSWNIEWFPKNGNTTANYVETILTNLNADVYALQEIGDTTLLKTLVSNIPGYECHFVSSYYGGLTYVYNTNTVQINDKYEIYTSQAYWNAFPRSPQVLNLDFMGENIFVINNHLKCCGDETLNINDPQDEENRRLMAITYLKEYMDSLLHDTKIILLGDLNDILTDSPQNNIFNSLINDTTNYLFVDMDIAANSSNYWSYPSWPSHLDHILISNELFPSFQSNYSNVSCIRIDDYMNSWFQYENNISDHRPIGLKLNFNQITNILETDSVKKELLKIVDVFGREVTRNTKGTLFYIYNNGFVEKKISTNW